MTPRRDSPAVLERRRTLKLLAASLALAGLTGCDDSEPSGVLIPPVLPAPDSVSRGSHLYASASVLNGYAAGVLVRHANGRPIKVEGNPAHPASLGATDAIAQAGILGFYDPDRAAGMTRDGVPLDAQNLATDLLAMRTRWAQTRGEGLRVLTGTVTSPTFARQMAALQQHYPALRWHQWEPLSREAVQAGARLAYGAPVEIVPKLDAAQVVLALDSDLFSGAPGHVRFAHDLATRRNPVRNAAMPRVYAAEPTPTLIGVAADHRFIAGPRDLHRALLALAAAVLGHAAPADAPDWVAAVAADLAANRGRAFVHLGPDHPAEAHALVHAINEALGGRGATYELIQPVAVPAAGSLADLVADMQAGRVQSLIVIDSNPVFTAPPTLGFTDALQRVPFSLALSVEPNETSAATHWALPQRHPFEDWSDARAFDGTATILQPQALPLFDGISPHQLLAWLTDATVTDPRAIVQQTWQKQVSGDFGAWWQGALSSGLVPDTAAPRADVGLRPEAGQLNVPAPPDRPTALLFRPDPSLWDGRFANNAWLQELPRPLSKVTWDNPLLLSPEQGRRLGVAEGDRVIVQVGPASVTLPVWIMPGQAPDTAVALLGYGRRVVGAVGRDTGFDVFPLTGRPETPDLRKAAGHEMLARTEHHDPMLAVPEDFVRHGVLAAFQADPHLLADHETTPSLYRWKPAGPAAWGMSIDLNACIGCNACVVACMAENNIPVVGKQEVIREREMHWLRIDRYYDGGIDNARALFQPMLCMHCEQAPCELVCPVGATVHDSEGLNVMVYNRCIGTRFCSNNCPYKVRRFNFHAFTQEEHRPPQARNPDVTVRERGVMEKCTFCLQRIAEARIAADIADRPIGGNAVQTACQAACPTQAFTFGNMAEADAAVLARKQSPLSYAVLEDQNTHPRVTYEGRIDNPNPAIQA